MRRPSTQTIQRIARKSLSQLPIGFSEGDIPQAGLRLTKELKQAVRRARNSKGLTLYLPVERVHGMMKPASSATSEPIATDRKCRSRQRIANITRAAENVSACEIDGRAGVRALPKFSTDPEQGVKVPFWPAQFTVPAPKSAPASWLTSSLSTLVAQDIETEFTETLVESFDAVMTTFHWSYA